MKRIPPMMQNDITPRQKSIVEYIAETIESEGFPPTLQEIGAHFGISSTNGVFDHLRTLERKGYIERSPKARSIRLTQKALAGMVRGGGNALPLVGRVAAGQPLLALENVEDYVFVSPQAVGREAFCLRVSGESMIDAGLLPGDIIIVDKTVPPRPGDIVVALIGGEATVKYYHNHGDAIELRPANHTMRPMVYPAEEVSIQGVVVALQRSLTSRKTLPA
ncbi:MAG: transcriptional repressor LexA [Candidatus Hydrogenedentes bacterium]|nr:transcriptional repressor LexA [Candidatus Hydrogenedentota bacterium]